ncbi:MAG TPA: FAD-binding oxidoreductase [Bryobacteraceae bacterium]|jgi:sarcosine oxidase subunit beta|nr:FAD-binding oxidoreductase [Bryobacteraceae bacterium]
MRKSADVVIVGGGIVGASIAYQLTKADCCDVVILERESSQGKGSTGKSMGGVRAQFSTPVNIAMSLYSIPFFHDFERTMGYPSGYRAQGYLFMATTELHLDYLRENHQRQVAAGLKTASLVSRDDIAQMVPQLRSDDIIGGSFCSTDGFVDPYSVMNGFTLRAVDQGAELNRDARVTGLSLDAKGIAGVETTQGTIATRTVVNCAGPWAAEVAKFAGIDLPVEPLRRMLVPTEPFDRVEHSVPMVVDMSTGFHFRPEGRGLLLAWNDPDEKPGFNTTFDRGFVEKILIRAVNRVPVFEHLEVNPSRAWAGLYEMTPDHHPILGAAPGVGGFYFANGFSGHGVMHSPATGKILADLILKGSTDLIDAKLLDYARFAEGRLIEETAVL